MEDSKAKRSVDERKGFSVGWGGGGGEVEVVRVIVGDVRVTSAEKCGIVCRCVWVCLGVHSVGCMMKYR